MENHIRHITLSLLLKTIRQNIKILLIIATPIIVIIILICVMLNISSSGIFYTTGAVQINNYASSNFVDQQIDLDKQFSSYSSTLSNLATYSEIQEALLRTSYILEPVIKKDHLDIDVEPIVFPIIGSRIVQFCRNRYAANAVKMPNYCHNILQKLSVHSFDVNSPYLNKKFTLKVIAPNQYALYKGQEKILTASPLELVTQNGVTIQIDSPLPPVGTKFNITKISMDLAVKDLSDHITINSVNIGEDPTPPITGVVTVSMMGNMPNLQAQIINDIIDQLKLCALKQKYTQLNSTIDFVDAQINNVKNKLALKQESIAKFQTANNIISLNDQEKNYIDQLATVEQSILENKIAISQFSNLYAHKHPIMLELNAQKSYLIAKKNQLDAKLSKLPKDAATYVTLTQNLQVYQGLYSLLLNKKQELQIKLFNMTSPIYVLYYATANVAPAQNKDFPINLLVLSLFASLVIIISIFLYIVFGNNNDPWLMSKMSNIPLLATFPYQVQQGNICRALELITSYLLQQKTPQALIVNFAGTKPNNGTSFIISKIVKYLQLLNKTSVVISFGMEKDCKSVTQLIEYIRAQNPTTIQNKQSIKLKVNLLNAMDIESISTLLNNLNGFDFIFMDAPSVTESALFFNLATITKQNILVISPNDKPSTFAWVIHCIANMKISIQQIIFNHPQKTLLQPGLDLE